MASKQSKPEEVGAAPDHSAMTVTPPAVEQRMPRIGEVVQYRLTQADADQVTLQRKQHGTHMQGNPVEQGTVAAMVITTVWGGSCVNGQVLLDGNDHIWVTSRNFGDGNGLWIYA